MEALLFSLCLSSFGFPSQNTLARWLINSRNLLFTVLEAECVQGQVAGKFSVWWFLVHRQYLLAVPLPGGRDKGSLWSLFYIRPQFHSHGLHTGSLSTSQRLHLLIPLPWALGFGAFGGNTNIQCRASLFQSLLFFSQTYLLQGKRKPAREPTKNG